MHRRSVASRATTSSWARAVALAGALSGAACLRDPPGPGTVHGAAVQHINETVSCPRAQVRIASVGRHDDVTVYRAEGCGGTWVLECRSREAHPCMRVGDARGCWDATSWRCDDLRCRAGDESCAHLLETPKSDDDSFPLPK